MQESTTLEVHMAVGTDYSTVASCRLRFRDIFDKPQGRVRGVADVISEYRSGVVCYTCIYARGVIKVNCCLQVYSITVL